MIWFKKKKQESVKSSVIPSALELKEIIKQKRLDKLADSRKKIGDHFKLGRHPFTNKLLVTFCKYGTDIDNDLIDELKLELESLGYEVNIKIDNYEEHVFKNWNGPGLDVVVEAYTLEYREIKMKE
jgi:hypothetical protein